ncbi:MAG TPA: lytic transglycosylase domain-containing protein [Oligoflexus sp.]|uniref:lytic transglycosylase domain-containing protein n=1 Tax=Oligoflexus sp. TaxID=1971216 RepID=UPI002D38320D|nr:lytic transglycosylase domain-containing protein [Oligoflexus sp.]HYX35891.1 lytic transglycosylase domain-containing protein [Oligoflexus sp.]
MRYIRTALFCLWLPWSAEARTQAVFPSSPIIEQRVQFWEKIFSRHPSHHIVIHDKDDLATILGVIQLRSQGFDNSDSPGAERFIQATMRRYAETLEGFAERGPAVRHEHALAAAIWNACSTPQARDRLLKGQIALRGQGGLSDTFREAFRTSELYLPRMERIFRNHGLPPELTRIVFVESMFNLRARSKVGASGLWQLMPKTARAYIRVNRYVDERNSPLKATEAAARILRGNHAELGNWPLAITAYNHGLGGMKRAVARTGSTRLSDIIQRYRSPSFGFASSNFYAEFLAALRVHGVHHNRSNRRTFAEQTDPADPSL